MERGESPAILIVTDLIDPTADLVVDELVKRETPVFRCNPGDFPQRLVLAARIDGGGLGGTLSAFDVHTGQRQDIDLALIKCGYYRRPTAFRIPESVPEAWFLWAAREARQGFGGVVSAVPRWLNHPANIAFAEYKPVQLRYAVECGLTIPHTIVTNDPHAAKVFTDQVGRLVHKRLSGVPGPGEPFAHLIDPSDLDVTDTAHLLQEFVDKSYDVRVTVVDDSMFAVRIDYDCTSTESINVESVDWRTAYASHRYTVVDIPPFVRSAIQSLLRRLRLRFGAFDFGVTEDGRWTFFEINPNGQWAWIQHATGLPIAAAVAEALDSWTGVTATAIRDCGW